MKTEHPPKTRTLSFKTTRWESDFFNLWAQRLEMTREELSTVLVTFTIHPPKDIENQLLARRIEELKPRKSEVPINIWYMPQTAWIKFIRIKRRVFDWFYFLLYKKPQD